VWRIPIGDRELSSGGIAFTRRASTKSEQGYGIMLEKFTMIEQGQKKAGLLGRMATKALSYFQKRMQRYMLEQMIKAESQPSGFWKTQSDTAAEMISSMKSIQNPEAISYMAMMREMQGKRPFMSIKGYVGIGPASIQPGDIICVLLGARVPYILRSVESGGFTLVGEAYCDGIMDGEIVKGTPLKEAFELS